MSEQQQQRSVRAKVDHDPSPGGITLAELKAKHDQYRREEEPLMLEMRRRIAKALAREEAALQETRKRFYECYMRSHRAHTAKRLQAICRGYLTRRALTQALKKRQT